MVIRYCVPSTVISTSHTCSYFELIMTFQDESEYVHFQLRLREIKYLPKVRHTVSDGTGI